MPDPAHTVAEMARVAERWLLVSVPREPLWRALNMARGAYLQGPRQHARARQPLVQALVRGAARRATARSSRRARRSRGRCCSSGSDRRPPAPARASGYGRGARILSIGIAPTGVVTFAYFSVASYVLDDVAYKQISLLWSVLFVTVSVIYRPIEQLLSRTIADRRARGFEHDHPLRTPLILQAGFALAFLVLALALRGPIQDDLFDGSATLYWILVVARARLRGELLRARLARRPPVVRLLRRARVPGGVARGWPSRSPSRSGSPQGQSAVALGMAAAPFVSLVVVPWAFSRAAAGRRSASATRGRRWAWARGGRFALAVLAVMIAEQTLLNAAVLLVDVTAADAAVAGFVFNVLLIARAPLQLFQAIQGSLLPHLAGLEARAGARGVRAARSASRCSRSPASRARSRSALVLIGPFVMDLLFDDAFTYGRWGLALVAIGMGAHLVGRHAQPGRARARPRRRGGRGCWLLTRRGVRGLHGQPARRRRAACAREVGYCGAAALLCALLARCTAPAGARRRAGRAQLLLRAGHVRLALLDQHGLLA